MKKKDEALSFASNQQIEHLEKIFENEENDEIRTKIGEKFGEESWKLEKALINLIKRYQISRTWWVRHLQPMFRSIRLDK